MWAYVPEVIVISQHTLSCDPKSANPLFSSVVDLFPRNGSLPPNGSSMGRGLPRGNFGLFMGGGLGGAFLGLPAGAKGSVPNGSVPVCTYEKQLCWLNSCVGVDLTKGAFNCK